MNKWTSWLYPIMYPLLLAFIAGIVAGANYTAGTFLSGWDTLHPEFNFPLAFSRLFTGVWRQDQGLGAVAIQSHMADLPRVILLFLGSFVMPLNLLRYASFLITLAVGPVGIYYLVRHILAKQHGPHKQFIAFFSALTYFFNLGTVQHFIVPLEMFAFHYALLPWLLFTGLLVLENGSKVAFFAFVAITLLAAPQAHTATLFYAYFGVFSAFVSTYALLRTNKRIAFKRAIILIATTVFLNAYWLVPNAYAIITKSEAVRRSKVNALFSDEAFAKTQKFGTIADAALIKNFLFDWQLVDPKTNAQIDVMAAWSDHMARHPVATAYGYTVFFFAFLGLLSAFWNKQRELLSFVPVLIIPLVFLLNGTWPMTTLLMRLKEAAPVLGEALRFPFTKFSILYMAAFSMFAGIGLLQIFQIMKRISVIRITKATVIILSFYYFLPAFTGNLVHPSMRVSIPQEYFDAFSWFQKQNPDSRVAILPIYSFWNWVNYRWGYQGAGFLQFGIPQPILDRDYDRWSPMNENYYWELSRAIYAKDPAAVDAVLSKYDVRYMLLDENIISRDHDRSLFIDETKSLLARIPTIHVARTFGNITVYERWIPDQVGDDIKIKTNLPTVYPAYTWTDNDVAYRELGNYITDSSCHVSGVTCHVFPFRSLFTKRSIDEREFTITETDTMLTIGDTRQASTAGIVKRDASVFEATNSAILNPQAVVPCGISGKGTAKALTIGSSAASDSRNQTIKPDQKAPSDTSLRFTSQNQRGCLSFDVSQLPHKDSYLVAVENRHVTGRPLILAFINDTARHAELETYLESQKEKGKRQIEDWQTDYFVLPPLASDGLGYTVYISNDAIGNQETVNDIKSIKFYRFPYQELVMLRSLEVQSKSAELQPQGRALSATMNQNVIVSHPNPAYYKISLQPAAVSLEARDKSNQPEQTTLVLSQSFDPGWLAYEVETCDTKYVTGNALLSFLPRVTCRVSRIAPFFFGTQIKDHVLVNNWENGWRLNAGGKSNTSNTSYLESTIILFFWPQLLEWVGFLLLPIPLIYFLFDK